MIKKAYRKMQKHINFYVILKYINIYTILKHKTKISLIFATLTIGLGITGFSLKGDNFWVSIFKSIKLFFFDFHDEYNDLNPWIIGGAISAFITVFFTVIAFFIKDRWGKSLINNIFNTDHITVFGLGEASTSFLRSYAKMKRKEGIAIIESDPNNKKLEEFRKNGFGVFVGEALSDKTLELLNFKTMKYAIIALGSDRINIELAEKIIKIYKEKDIKTEIKLIIHILNRDLDTLFHQKFMLSGSVNTNTNNDKAIKHKKTHLKKFVDRIKRVIKKEKDKKDEAQKVKIDIKTFSFFNEAAEELFEEHRIDGIGNDYIKNDTPFKSILTGNGKLVRSVIYQMALISHLPNENVHTVYIVDKYAENLLIEIKKQLYYKKKNFPTFKLKAINIDSDSLKYFKHKIWHMKDLVNVIIAYDTEAKNLDLAVELFNRTYLSNAMDNLVNAMDKQNMPKIIFAIFDQLLLSDNFNLKSAN